MSAMDTTADNLDYCLKNLVAVDSRPLHPECVEDGSLQNLTRTNVERLVARLFALPRTKNENGLFANLPKEARYILPRMYPLPKPKQKTRWQLFAEARGIQKRKRSRLAYDEAVGDWVPRWGYKSINKGPTAAPPIVELKEHEYRQGVNPIEERAKQGKIQKTRQKIRELRNKAENAKGTVDKLKNSLAIAAKSTKSAGKFDKPKVAKITKKVKQISRKVTVKSLKEERESYKNSIKKLKLA